MITILRRIMYFGYYLRQLDWESFHLFMDYTRQKEYRSRLAIWIDIFYHSLKYNISILEYFQFGFSTKTHEDKKEWAGTGFMYEFQLKMNPLNKRDILDDKRKFAICYQRFLIHHVIPLDHLKNDKTIFERLFQGHTEKMVLKYADGKCGLGVEIVNVNDFSSESLIQYMERKELDVAETYIQQHDDLNHLSPAAVNTVRIFTQLDANDEVKILGCRQRISVNNNVDNLAAGNIVAAIDEDTGELCSKGYYSNITKEPVEYHPVTGVKIIGFKVPKWEECLKLAKEAALHNTSNRSIGWDIVVTNTGVGLIEGNHDWCKLVWQLPVQKGLKSKLEKLL